MFNTPVCVCVSSPVAAGARGGGNCLLVSAAAGEGRQAWYNWTNEGLVIIHLFSFGKERRTSRVG